MTVYWDHKRAQNVNAMAPEWEGGIVEGLLHSLCFFPIMSYGGTAPLALLPHDAPAVWDTEPLGLKRLEGTELDREDSVLKVFLRRLTPNTLLAFSFSLASLPSLQYAEPFVHSTQELLVASVLLENKDNVETENGTLAEKSCLKQVGTFWHLQIVGWNELLI